MSKKVFESWLLCELWQGSRLWKLRFFSPVVTGRIQSVFKELQLGCMVSRVYITRPAHLLTSRYGN